MRRTSLVRLEPELCEPFFPAHASYSISVRNLDVHTGVYLAWPPTWQDTIIQAEVSAPEGARLLVHASPFRVFEVRV